MKPTQHKPQIAASVIEHRGGLQIALRFPYDVSIKKHLHQLEGLRWSQTHRCYYLEYTPENVHRLLQHCRGMIWVDLEGLSEWKRTRFFKKPETRATAVPKKPRTDISEPRLSEELLHHIAVFRRWMEQMRYSPSTVKTYTNMVRKFFAAHPSRRWDTLTNRDILNYNHSEFIQNNRSFSTQNQFVNAIKLFYRSHGMGKVLPESIDRPRKERRLPQVLTKEEVAAILRNTRNRKHHCLLTLIYSAGLRIGETLNLTWSDIRSEENLIYIRGGKGRKDRRVPLAGKMRKLLADYRKAYGTKRYVFEGQSGGKYSSRSAQRVLKRAVTAAGIRARVTLHTLRHSYATHLLESGVGLRYIQEILGHNSPKTTMLYTHVSGKRLGEVRSPVEDMDI